MIYDLSPPITPALAVWPGDTPMSRRIIFDMAPPQRANITLSTLTATVHLGSHADGPNHYSHPAGGVGERSLDFYLGPCHVLDAPGKPGTRVGTGDVAWPGGAGPAGVRHPRVLLRTGTYPDPERWRSDFAGLEPALVDALAAHGVRTIGVDAPSVDLFESKDLPAHAACARHDISILEGLVMKAVPPGEYELIALPLRLVGFDGSPVRAVLRTLDE